MSAVVAKLIDNGAIYLGSYAGWYAVRDEAFYAESEIVDGKRLQVRPSNGSKSPLFFPSVGF